MSKQLKTILLGGGTGPEKEKKKPRNEAEHNAQQREKRLSELSAQEPELYAKMEKGNELNSLIALRGGLPKYQAPAKKPAGPPPTPTNFKEIGFGTPKRKPAGYRYTAGSGKPAKESLTRRRKINLK